LTPANYLKPFVRATGHRGGRPELGGDGEGL
jgi:hypothetical protein